MSFLNPSATFPKLGVGIAPLVYLRDLDSASNAPDLMQAVHAAEAAGADAIVLALTPERLYAGHRDVDAVMSAMTQAHLALPLTPAMVDFAGTVRPHSVCFNAAHGAANDNTLSDATLDLVRHAVAQFNRQSVQLIMALDPGTHQLQAMHDAGVTVVAFNTGNFARAGASEQAAQFSALQTAVLAARRYGMTVHLGHGIRYSHISLLATLGDIAQFNVGHAIAARAVVVGWQSAVREMKALLVAACAPSMGGLAAPELA